jgi:hypothetical protein
LRIADLLGIGDWGVTGRLWIDFGSLIARRNRQQSQ